MSGLPCRDCFSGTAHVGTPTGTTTTIHGLPVYVSNPPDGVIPRGIIVIVPDAFGWEFVNNRLLSDRYAEQGNFLVYLPDFMNGNSLSFKFVDIMEEKINKPASWFITLFYKPIYIVQALWLLLPWYIPNRFSICQPRIFSFFRELRTSPPPFPTHDLRLGAAGFCWGGLYAIKLVQDAPSTRVARHESQAASASASDSVAPLIDCAFVAHPSLVAVPRDIEAVTRPLSVAVGDEDMAMKREQIVQMKDILEVKKRGDHEVVIMPGAKHGFAVRVDPKDEQQLEYADKAEVQAVQWFSRWFA